MFEIQTTGDYYADLGTAREARALPDIAAELAVVSRERFRRIDRFAKLALIGSGRCTQSVDLPVRTGLYISSGFGSIANTQAVQQQIYLEHRIPKPLNFINTLSNSAGYYVARNLGLHARNLFVGRDIASGEAALQMGLQDLKVGRVDAALVGAVDEAAEPLLHHANRLGVEADVSLAEGSHWLLMRNSAVLGNAARVDDVSTLHNKNDLTDWLSQAAASRHSLLYLHPDTSDEISAVCPALDNFSTRPGVYGSSTLGAVVQFLDSGKARELLTIAEDRGRIHVMRICRGV